MVTGGTGAGGYTGTITAIMVAIGAGANWYTIAQAVVMIAAGTTANHNTTCESIIMVTGGTGAGGYTRTITTIVIALITLVTVGAGIFRRTGFTGIAGEVTRTLAEAGTGGTIKTGTVTITLIGGSTWAGRFTIGAKVAIQTFLAITAYVPVTIASAISIVVFAIMALTMTIALVVYTTRANIVTVGTCITFKAFITVFIDIPVAIASVAFSATIFAIKTGAVAVTLSSTAAAWTGVVATCPIETIETVIAIGLRIPVSFTGYAFSGTTFAVKTGAAPIANIVGTAGAFLVTIRPIITGGALVTIGAVPAGFTFITVGTGKIAITVITGTIA